jgi:hypothetical protein
MAALEREAPYHNNAKDALHLKNLALYIANGLLGIYMRPRDDLPWIGVRSKNLVPDPIRTP